MSVEVAAREDTYYIKIDRPKARYKSDAKAKQRKSGGLQSKEPTD